MRISTEIRPLDSLYYGFDSLAPGCNLSQMGFRTGVSFQPRVDPFSPSGRTHTVQMPWPIGVRNLCCPAAPLFFWGGGRVPIPLSSTNQPKDANFFAWPPGLRNTWQHYLKRFIVHRPSVIPRKSFALRHGPIWLWVKTVLGSHFGVGEFTTHFRTFFNGDWDVHWGYDLDFDPWPFALAKARGNVWFSFSKGPHEGASVPEFS